MALILMSCLSLKAQSNAIGEFLFPSTTSDSLKHEVFLDVMAPIYGQLGVGYSYQFNPHFGALLKANIPIDTSIGPLSGRRWWIYPAVRAYIGQGRGFFVELTLPWSRESEENNNLWRMGYGVGTGYRVKFAHRFTAEIGTSIGRFFSSAKVNSGNSDPADFFALGYLNLGVRF